MDFFVENLYTVVLLPVWVALIILLGKLFCVMQSRRLMAGLTMFSTFYALVFAIGTFTKTAVQKGFELEKCISFIKLSNFSFDVGVYVDGVSAWLLLLSALVSLIVQIYSYSYMQYDKSFMRFFAYINFFNFAIFGLFLSPNMFQTYVFWELVGVASYLLIGFWYKKADVAIASKKAFIINRIGDFSLLSGIITASYIIISNFNFYGFVSIPFADISNISAQIYGCTSDGVFILTCLLLIMGAVAKSAQFPLHTWLIDAMKGPTPVSALIHSATMVAAGVFLLIRLYPMFSLNDVVLHIISIIGIVTALICSFAALTQNDIKKILAYSTNAQLGLMFLAVGMCSTTIALFHLTSHAFIKAMLFLSAGVVITALNSNQDIKFAGGLRKQLPVAATTFLIGAFSLSGLLFSGFSSKELILGKLLESNHYVYAILFLIVAFMTTFYLFRLYFNVFEGEKRFDSNIKTPDLLLNLSPSLLAILVVLLWFVLPKSENWIFAIISYTVSLPAIFIAYVTYYQKSLLRRLPVLYDISFNALYIEDIYSIVVKQFNRFAKMMNLFEKYVFDGITYISYLNVRLLSWFLAKMQTGNVQSYLSYSILILMVSFGGILFVYSLIMYFSEVQ